MSCTQDTMHDATLAEGGTAFFDMHCHLGFASNAQEAAGELAGLGAGAFATCVTPAEYRVLSRDLAAFPCVQVGVGLHPWWVSAGRIGDSDVQQAAQLAAEARFIGEVGLDFGAAHAGSADGQVSAFRRIMAAAAQAASGQKGAKLVSLHAVRSADAVLDILEQTGAIESCTCIFHWYSDTPEALQRAIRLGCRFSLGVRSLGTRRGREYARQIAPGLLLLETDEPAEGRPYDVAAMQLQLAQACAQLEGIKGQPLAGMLADASRSLLGMPGEGSGAFARGAFA